MTPRHREGHGLHPPPLPRLRPALHEVVGRWLSLHYAEMRQQPLPSRLATLLRQLDDQRGELAASRRR